MFERERGQRSSTHVPAAKTEAKAAEVKQLPPQLRSARHSGLFQAVQQLDTAGLDVTARAELASWITDQYANTYGSVPLGFVSICYLGPPKVDHYLNLLMSIVDHFAANEEMPMPFAAARMLARNTAYEFVEVHDNGLLVPIRPDGTAVV